MAQRRKQGEHKTVQYSNTLHIFSRNTSCLLHFDDSITYIISTPVPARNVNKQPSAVHRTDVELLALHSTVHSSQKSNCSHSVQQDTYHLCQFRNQLSHDSLFCRFIEFETEPLFLSGWLQMSCETSKVVKRQWVSIGQCKCCCFVLKPS